MKRSNSSTHIVRSTDSLVDIIESDAFSLKGISLHCSFKFDARERWLYTFFNKAWIREVEVISFSNGKLLKNPKYEIPNTSFIAR